MESGNLILRPLCLEDEASFLDAIAAFRNDTPPFSFASHHDATRDFQHHLRLLEDWSQGRSLPAGWVPNSFLVGVVDGRIVGRISIRHHVNDSLERVGGHIGYAVIPDCRRRGHARAMLRQSLPICAGLGLKRILLTCDEDNLASCRVIERCGGVFAGLCDEPETTLQKRRYWIELESAGA
ncbi:MAG: GNAT family N-acetyltransferase [Candidatus Delongbacteria bacterium]|nr:GNAT family N-acetyltransferase [Candidatus Delongbacteria bacterium]